MKILFLLYFIRFRSKVAALRHAPWYALSTLPQGEQSAA